MYLLILFQLVNETFILFLYLCFSILLSELLLIKGRNMTLFYLVHFNVVTCEHRLTLKLMTSFAHVVATERLGLRLQNYRILGSLCIIILGSLCIYSTVYHLCFKLTDTVNEAKQAILLLLQASLTVLLMNSSGTFRTIHNFIDLLLKYSVYSVPFESLVSEWQGGGGVNYGALLFTVVLGLSITEYWTLSVL